MKPKTTTTTTEQERRLQALWDRAAVKAISTGFPPTAVATSMMAAAVMRLADAMGPAAMAQYLGRIAVEFHEKAGGEIDEVLPGEADNDGGPSWNN